jgi:hypothetical protein
MRVTLARLVVGLAVLALPLVATGAAQAAIAGASPAVTSSRPDIRSATILSATSVEVCTDKTLNGVFTFAGFALGGYRAGNLAVANTAATDPTNTNCAIVGFPATIGDINQYTFLSAAPGTYFANAGTVPNAFDSVALTGSTSHSGTTGVETAPNLIGILAPDGTHQLTNSLTFVFDKAANVLSAPDFFFETSGGNICTGASVLAGNDSTTVTITMSPTTSIAGSTCSASTVVQAVRGGVFLNGTNAVQDLSSTNPNESVVLPNCTSPCATSRPDVVSAVLGSDNDSIVFTYDHPVVVVGSGAGTFQVDLANAQDLNSTGAVGTGTTTVTVNFGGALSARAEYAVNAWADSGSVEAADNVTPSGNSLPGSAPVGDNAGAFASGFTTGPDVFGISMNKTTGAVVVNLDQRITAVATGGISVIGLDGNVIATATPSTNFNSSAGPGPATLTLNYPPSQLTNATMIQFLPGAMTTGLNPVLFAAADGQNVAQVVEAVQSGALLKAYKAYEKRHKKHAKHHSSKKHHSHKR